MKSVFLIPDGVGYRNLALSGVLERVAAVGDVHVLHALPDVAIRRWARRAGNVKWSRLPAGRTGGVETSLQLTLKHAHLRASGSRAHRWRSELPSPGRWHGRWLARAARTAARLAASPTGLERLHACYLSVAARSPMVDRYRRLFDALRPDVVVCSNHLMESFIAPVLAARSLAIPTAVFVSSWDSVTTNERILAPFDHYLVWSELMGRQLRAYYPQLAYSRVHVVGASQFTLYARDELLWSRREFCARVGADPDRPLICYTGGLPRTDADEVDHIAALLELVRDEGIHGAPQVLLRRNPADWTGRHAVLRARFPELIVSEPLWEDTDPGNWTGIIPHPDDVRLMANVVRHADLNVNVASTMSLDFAVCDTPVINIAFDTSSPPRLGLPLWEHFYQWDHYRPVWQLGAVRVAHSTGELATHANAYLANPALDHEGRRRLVELEVGAPCAETPERVAETLNRLARQPELEPVVAQ